MPFLRVYIINKAVPAPVTTLIICDSVLFFKFQPYLLVTSIYFLQVGQSQSRPENL